VLLHQRRWKSDIQMGKQALRILILEDLTVDVEGLLAALRGTDLEPNA
jgi:hypothetical protein